MSEPRVIERLAYGAHGVTRADGKVLFVRGTAPGDVVEVEVVEDHGNYAYAKVTKWVDESPVRRAPPCEYLPACGGCPWQHLSYEAQLAAKAENVADHLRRIARIESPPLRPILPSPEEWEYRSRLSLRCHQGRVGFFAAASHDLIDIERCRVGAPALNIAWSEVADLVRRLRSRVHRCEVARIDAIAGQGVALSLEVEGDLVPSDDGVLQAFLASAHHVRGVAMHGRRWRRGWGEETITISPQEDMRLHAAVGAFTQVNPLANRLLVEQVLQLGEFRGSDRVLDLYAGAGNLTFPIARHVAHITAVEQDRLGALAAKSNAAALRQDNVDVLQADARQAVARWRGEEHPLDVIVLDPPRSGVAPLVPHLLRLAVPRLLYVSCNPTTLARDLKDLGSVYRVDAVQPIDMFPHTYHVEVVARAVLA